MTTLDRVPVEWSPVHLLLISRTKFGKSTYAAVAAKMGYRMIYVDSDNGISALQNALGDDVEALKRVHYIKTESPYLLLRAFFQSHNMAPFRWVVTKDAEFTRTGKWDESDEVIEIYKDKMPRIVILDIDSWTSLAADAMELGAKAKHTDVIEMGDKQGVYGEASTRLTYIANKIQAFRSHVIVQAHDTVYEMYEKPTGQAQANIKQKDMILRDVIQIPVSSSRPHGYSMGKQFNFIGWLDANLAGSRTIDFRTSSNRVGGGPPGKIAPLAELPFARLVDPKDGVIPADPGTDGWLRYIPATQLVQELGPATIGTAKANPQGVAVPSTSPQKASESKPLPSGPLGKLLLKTQPKQG